MGFSWEEGRDQIRYVHTVCGAFPHELPTKSSETVQAHVLKATHIEHKKSH